MYLCMINFLLHLFAMHCGVGFFVVVVVVLDKDATS